MAKFKIGDKVVYFAYSESYDTKNYGVIIKIEESSHPYSVQWRNEDRHEHGWRYSADNLIYFADPNDILKELVNG